MNELELLYLNFTICVTSCLVTRGQFLVSSCGYHYIVQPFCLVCMNHRWGVYLFYASYLSFYYPRACQLFLTLHKLCSLISRTVFLHFLWFPNRLTIWCVYCVVRIGLWNSKMTFSWTLIDTPFLDTKTKMYGSDAAYHPLLDLVIECGVLLCFTYRLPFLSLHLPCRRPDKYLPAPHGGYLCLNRGICGRQYDNETSFSSSTSTSQISSTPPSLHSRSTYSAIILAIDVVNL